MCKSGRAKSACTLILDFPASRMSVVETTQSMVFYYTIPGQEQGGSGGREGVFCLNWLRLKGGNRNML